MQANLPGVTSLRAFANAAAGAGSIDGDFGQPYISTLADRSDSAASSFAAANSFSCCSAGAGMGGSLFSQSRWGFRDLILEVERLPPLIFEPARDLFLLTGQGGFAIDEPQFPLVECRL